MNRILCHLVDGKLLTTESLQALLTTRMSNYQLGLNALNDVVFWNRVSKSCTVGLADGSVIFIRPVIVTYKSFIVTPYA